MLSQLLSYGKYGKLFCGVEHTNANRQEKLNVLILKKKKDEFLIENSLESNTVVELSDQLQKGQHLFLIINTKKVLFKTLNSVLDAQKAIALAFPNLQLNHFYCEVLQSRTTTFVVICRKEYIDTIIDDYQKNNYNIIGFSLGNLVASQLCGVVKDTILQTSTNTISFDSQTVTEITDSDEVYSGYYDINGLQITPNNVLPLAGILTYYTSQKKTVSNFDTITNKLNDDFKQKRIFELGLKVGLATVFVLLLVSFLFFSSYSSKINILTTELELNKSHKNTLLKLSGEVQKKERLVNNFSLSSSKSSWYLDQIGSSIPTSILLSEIQFQPLLKNIKEDKEIQIQNRVLLIKGKSGENNNFSNWLDRIEQQDWVDKVTILKYGTGKRKMTEFELQIEINK